MSDYKLFLFTTDDELAEAALAGGVDYIIVDWERGAKRTRQAGTGFQIGEDSLEDARRLAGRRGFPVFVRVNPMDAGGASEVREALEAGASGLMLPMSRNAAEIRDFLARVPRGIRTLVQIETAELAASPESIRDLGWDFVHVGLNDLMLARRSPSIWTAVLDGTIERICAGLEGRAFGFGGMTVVDGGSPVPARLVMLEMARLRCSMGVLRRSFRHDVVGRDPADEVAAIRRLVQSGATQGPARQRQQRSELEASIREAGG